MSAPGAVSAGSLVPRGQQATNQKLVDDYTDPTTNEGNLLSLITLKNILGGAGGIGGVDDTLQAMAKEETRHLMLAMKVLTADGAADMKAAKLQEKYGRDMSGAIALSKVLKSKSDEKEVDMLLNPFVMATIRGKGPARANRAGFREEDVAAGGAEADITGPKARSSVGTAWAAAV
jgi:hypothetical protein